MDDPVGRVRREDFVLVAEGKNESRPFVRGESDVSAPHDEDRGGIFCSEPFSLGVAGIIGYSLSHVVNLDNGMRFIFCLI